MIFIIDSHNCFVAITCGLCILHDWLKCFEIDSNTYAQKSWLHLFAWICLCTSRCWHALSFHFQSTVLETVLKTDNSILGGGVGVNFWRLRFPTWRPSTVCACSGIIHIESKECLNEMVGETFTYVTFKTVLKFVLVKRLKAWVIEMFVLNTNTMLL